MRCEELEGVAEATTCAESGTVELFVGLETLTEAEAATERASVVSAAPMNLVENKVIGSVGEYVLSILD